MQRSICSNVIALTRAVSGPGDGTFYGAAVDTAGLRSLCSVLCFTTADGQFAWRAQESDEESGVYTDIDPEKLTGLDVVVTGPTPPDGLAAKLGIIPSKRYVKIGFDVSGSTSGSVILVCIVGVTEARPV